MLVLGARVLDVLATGLGLLKARVLDGETVFRRRLVLLLPAHAVVHLVHVERGQANQVLGRPRRLVLVVIQARRPQHAVVLLPALPRVSLQIQRALDARQTAVAKVLLCAQQQQRYLVKSRLRNGRRGFDT